MKMSSKMYDKIKYDKIKNNIKKCWNSIYNIKDCEK